MNQHPQVWAHVHSLDLDPAVGEPGAVLARPDGGAPLFVALEPAARPLSEGVPLLLRAIAGVGAHLRHVETAVGAHGRVGTPPTALVLSDSSTVRCSPTVALALAAQVGVPVRIAVPAPAAPEALPALSGPVPSAAVLPV